MKKKTLALRTTALIAFAAGLATPAFAQDKTVKIGVLNDMSSLYADIGYDSEAAFHRAFKRVTGVTPGRWREGGLITAAAS